MPERLFNHGVPPQRIRTFLVLFALALTLPLIGLAALAFNQLASQDEAETERRVLQVAQSLVDDIDRELDRATITLETLATSADEVRKRLGIGSIFVTANRDPQTRQRALASQPLGLLEKPLTEQRLKLGLSKVV